MPKVHDTRRQRAARLLREVETGPSFTHYQNLTPQLAAELYKAWSRSWVLPILRELVPELRERK